MFFSFVVVVANIFENSVDCFEKNMSGWGHCCVPNCMYYNYNDLVP